jgi:formiminoglutamase
LGAAKAPSQIRKIASGLAIHFDSDQKAIVDAGDVICSGGKMEAAGGLLTKKIFELSSAGFFPVVLGGGHETAYYHYKGLAEASSDATIGIINLDAHFDLREYKTGSHSGSSFRQILDDCKQGSRPFHYLPIGIRPESNARSLFELMDKSKQKYVLLSDLQQDFEEVLTQISAFLEKVDKVYLSIDMDCFPSAYAPGVSAAAPDGMLPYHAIKVIESLKRSEKLLSVDIVEVNPTYDVDDRTSKLAAQLLDHLIH